MASYRCLQTSRASRTGRSITDARKPHGYELSTDPFGEEVRDIVDLYHNPPENVVVLCVYEKTQIKTLQRAQPLLTHWPGLRGGGTHDYIRHGTTTLFAALDVVIVAVFAECKPRHLHQEFLSFLRGIDKEVPKELDLHLIVDNYCTHKHAKVKAWVAQRARLHFHYTPSMPTGLARWSARLD